MANRDINLFKAAGGDRAKGSKASPMTYMVLFALVMVVAAIAVVVFFNMQASNAESAYKKKLQIQENYEITKATVAELSKEYKEEAARNESAKAIDAVIKADTALYPTLSDTELKNLKTQLTDRGVSVNDPATGEKFKPLDYEALRENLYKEMSESNPSSDEYLNRGVFYNALGDLATTQSNTQDNIWYGYYRCYFVMVCLGEPGGGWDNLIEELALMERSPFMHITMGGEFYTPSLYVETSVEGKSENCTVLLIPLKSVLERVYDLLQDHARMMYEGDDEGALSREEATFAIDNLVYTPDALNFDLILHKNAEYMGFIDALEGDPNFDVDATIYNPDDQVEGDASVEGDRRSYKVTLYYLGKTTASDGDKK